MYAGSTRCFENQAGLQSLYGDWGESLAVVNGRRKEAEREAALKLHQMFPDLTALPKQKKVVRTLEVKFLAKGGAVIPSTNEAEYKKNMAKEYKDTKGRNGG